MIVAPQQKRFTAEAKAAMHMQGVTVQEIARKLRVHPNSVYGAINRGLNPKVLASVCKLLNINAPTEE